MFSCRYFAVIAMYFLIGFVWANIRCYDSLTDGSTRISECPEPASCAKAVVETRGTLTVHAKNQTVYGCGATVEGIPLCIRPHMSGCMTLLEERNNIVSIRYCCCGTDKCNDENFDMNNKHNGGFDITNNKCNDGNFMAQGLIVIGHLLALIHEGH